MDLLEELKTLGVDTEEALQRMGGNRSLYERMLVKFLDMMQKNPISPDFSGEDYADVTEAVHTVKGVTGNLSITPLFEAYSKMVELFRGKEPEQAREILVQILPVQEQILECIKKNI